jgi:hypothetical protein
MQQRYRDVSMASAVTELTIRLNPDGTRDFGLLLLVETSQGVRYEHQVAGYLCEQRVAEGFLIPLGPTLSADPLADFFARSFRGNPPLGGWPAWAEDQRDTCANLISKVEVWDERRADPWVPLAIDSSRGGEITEGWIPVLTPYGSGILLFRNSD